MKGQSTSYIWVPMGYTPMRARLRGHDVWDTVDGYEATHHLLNSEGGSHEQCAWQVGKRKRDERRETKRNTNRIRYIPPLSLRSLFLILPVCLPDCISHRGALLAILIIFLSGLIDRVEVN